MSDNSEAVFSVLRCVYNTPKVILHRAIVWVRKQTFKRWELIILENGQDVEE
jgi:glycosyltransferase involved in cell wall biosynthesis